uniref:Rx N-terminal domain-containing protein n=1 Tax=Fagus sylvatica TaxID=28930 RepID=A0A2N9GTN1_FAGSY
MALSLVSGITQQLGSFITSEFKLTASVKEEIQKLESKFRTIQAVLNDAEKRQVKEEAVKLWLDKLKDVSYEMDDVLDEWNTAMIKAAIAKEEEEGEAETSTAKKRKVLPLIPNINFSILQHRDFAYKIKELNEKLDEIIKEREMYGFELTGAIEVVERPKTTSFVDVSEICGRDNVKGDLVSILLGKGSEEERSPHVISLVGMGGLPKQSLKLLEVVTPTDAEKCEELEVLGRQIAKKCKGLPLAAKTIGSLMRFKRSREQWENVLDSNLWELEDVEKIVEKDLFAPDELVEMWMAQGYINSKEDMEIIAREYFENLAIRSFFQDFEKDEDDDGCKLGELKDLNQLQGSLDIRGLGNVVDVCEAENAQLKKKIHLHTLILQFSGWNYRRTENDVSVLNALESPPNLKDLTISWYEDTTMSPNWTISLTKLKTLRLDYFKYLTHLPPLGKLPVLESLIIFYFNSLRKVGVEFLGIESENKKEDNMQIFPNLKYLQFSDLFYWEEWIGIGGKREEEEDSNITIMPRLQRLYYEEESDEEESGEEESDEEESGEEESDEEEYDEE